MVHHVKALTQMSLDHDEVKVVVQNSGLAPLLIAMLAWLTRGSCQLLLRDGIGKL